MLRWWRLAGNGLCVVDGEGEPWWNPCSGGGRVGDSPLQFFFFFLSKATAVVNQHKRWHSFGGGVDGLARSRGIAGATILLATLLGWLRSMPSLYRVM